MRLNGKYSIYESAALCQFSVELRFKYHYPPPKFTHETWKWSFPSKAFLFFKGLSNLQMFHLKHLGCNIFRPTVLWIPSLHQETWKNEFGLPFGFSTGSYLSIRKLWVFGVMYWPHFTWRNVKRNGKTHNFGGYKNGMMVILGLIKNEEFEFCGLWLITSKNNIYRKFALLPLVGWWWCLFFSKWRFANPKNPSTKGI